MAQAPFSLRRLFPRTRFSRFFTAIKPLAASYSSSLEPSLSARMSFVFDRMDELEKERSEKDETLHRIRAWRESKKAQSAELDSEISPKSDETVSDSPMSAAELLQVDEAKGMVQFVHPWPEWIDLMEMLVKQNYFDHRRIDEDELIVVAGFTEDSFRGSSAHDISGSAFKNFRAAHDAFVNLGEDRFDIFRSIAVQDILTLVGFGCPTNDKRVVFSSKFLRKYLQLDEGDVCSTCSLRYQCRGAFRPATTEDEARSLDIMRVLFTYGCDPRNRARMNPSVMKHKSVTTVVRKLLRQVVRLISVPIDPSLPRPPAKIRIPKVKKPPPSPRRRVGRADIEMKEGDWICPKCDFMNFSKNKDCLQCDEKRPKRQLLPGEWECPQCDFLNYRRNTLCFHCDHQQPPDDYMENKMQESPQSPRMRPERIDYRLEGIKAWNFDFDDDESDGADVSAFEYADSPAMEKGPFDNPGQGVAGRPEPDLSRASRDVRRLDEEYSDDEPGRPNNGFDDFADEEDDIDSYEIKDGNRRPVKTRVSSNNFREFESEAIAGSDNNFHGRGARSNPIRGKAFSGSDDIDSDSDSEDSAIPNPHCAPNSQSSNKQSLIMPKRRAFFGSDDDVLDMDDSPSRNFGSKQGGSNNDFLERGSPRVMRGSFSSSEDEDEESLRTCGNRLRGSAGPRRGGGNFRGRGNFESPGDRRFKSGGRRNSFDDDEDEDDEDEDFGGSSRGFRGRGGKSGGLRMNDIKGGSGGRRNSFDDDDDDFGGSSQGFHGRGSRGKSGWSRMNDGNSRTRRSGFGKRDFDEPRGGGSGKQHGWRCGGGRQGRDYSEDVDNVEYKNSRRIIER